MILKNKMVLVANYKNSWKREPAKKKIGQVLRVYHKGTTRWIFVHKTTNFFLQLSDWWLNCAYLEFRKPVVVWSSPGLVFPMQTFGSVADQLTYAANMVKAALSYKEIIDE